MGPQGQEDGPISRRCEVRPGLQGAAAEEGRLAWREDALVRLGAWALVDRVATLLREGAQVDDRRLLGERTLWRRARGKCVSVNVEPHGLIYIYIYIYILGLTLPLLYIAATLASCRISHRAYGSKLAAGHTSQRFNLFHF